MAIKRRGTMVEWKVTVPQDVAIAIELRTLDPVYGKPRYGARSQLITSLLKIYLQKRQEQEAQEAIEKANA